MTLRSIALVVLLAAGAIGWFFLEDSEAQVRNAHEQLQELISKSADETVAGVAVKALALRSLFAESIEITGDAEGLAGSYSTEELADMIIRLRSVVASVDLRFGELDIAFPESEEAIVEFSAELVAESQAIARRSEVRNVVSTLRDVDGAWRFSEFYLTNPATD